jgi:hypothetical protein
VKIKEINKERYAKIISKISQEQQKELNDFVDQVSENHPLFKYKNKYTSATVIKELKLEMSAYLTERESANQSKMHALHERQRRVTNLNWRRFFLIEIKGRSFIYVNPYSGGSCKNSVLKKNLIMSFYEHIMRKDEEEEGENYLYIVHTPCAMKIGEEILGWFSYRAKN